MTSGQVAKRGEEILEKETISNGGIDDMDAARIRPCLAQFRQLVDGRNSLIHAHPMTDLDGSQVLKHQGKHGRGGLTWARQEIDEFAVQISEAACAAIEVRRTIVEEQERLAEP